MNRQQIRERMEALAREAEGYLPNLNSADQKALREARSKHEACMFELDALVRQLRAMDTVEADDDPQFAGVVSRASLGAAVDAIVQGAELTGAEAEVQRERGLASNEIPVDMIAETRAIAPAPADTGATQANIVQPVFSQGDAAFLGIPQRRVPVGDQVFPVLTSRPTVGGPVANSDAIAETTGAFTAATLKPNRLQAGFSWLRTDAARFRGMDDALRTALNTGLSEALDKQIVAQLVRDNAQLSAEATADTFQTYRARLVLDRLDGRWASTEADIRILMSGATYGVMAGLVRSASTDADLTEVLRRVGVRMRVSPHVALVANHLQDVHIRRGNREDAVIGLWSGISLIPDEITRAAEGEVKLTAVLLAAFKITRPPGFGRVEVRHAV